MGEYADSRHTPSSHKKMAIYGKPYEYPVLSAQASRKHRADDMAAQVVKSTEVTNQ